MYNLVVRLLAIFILGIPLNICAREISLTFDDAPTPDSVLMDGTERTKKLISALKQVNVPDALFFVKADYINPQTAERLQQYTDAGFHLASHSFTHQSANQSGANAYAIDIYKAHLALKPFNNVLNFHRFPYLHYGKDLADINQLQNLLAELGYKDGYVTVDNFDWYISALITKAAVENKLIMAKHVIFMSIAFMNRLSFMMQLLKNL